MAQGEPQSSSVCEHKGLGTIFLGVEDTRYQDKVVHYRGIPYGVITERFAKPASAPPFEKELFDATQFGPQCPQPQIDIGHLLRLPSDLPSSKLEEDEFKCLNLNVHCPSSVSQGEASLPVVLWIHGGSQVMTFGSPSTAVFDPTRLVVQSISCGKPIIYVSFNYRLNIFAFGDGKGEVNLALQDQRLAIKWVSDHISEFGGDPNNITLAGESAGAVYTHAHILTRAPVNRAILVSGSLYLSPPLPQAIGAGLVQRLEKAVQEEEKRSLRHASASSLVKALTTCGINSMWLQDEPSFHGWQEKFETVKSLMIGDVEYESVLWRNGIETMSADEIADCFAAAGEYAPNLSRLYHINRSRPTQCKYGALDFINDSRFALPVDSIAKRWVREKKPVHQFVFDESNPWQSSSRAHHANDLSILFGGIDISHNRGAEQVGHHLRESWIVFANGESPWPAGKIYAFGPHGLCIGLSDDEYSLRRRTMCFEYLREMGLAPANAVVGRLAAGRISLLN